MSELESIGESLGSMFRRLGIPDPEAMSDLVSNWDVIAGQPWAGRSRAVAVSGQTLVVEASSPSLVAFLRYSVQDLLRALEARIGTGLITTVEVRPPSRGTV